MFERATSSVVLTTTGRVLVVTIGRKEVVPAGTERVTEERMVVLAVCPGTEVAKVMVLLKTEITALVAARSVETEEA